MFTPPKNGDARPRVVLRAEVSSTGVRTLRTISGEFGDEFGECSYRQGRGAISQMDSRGCRIAGLEDVAPRAAPEPDREEPSLGGRGDVIVQPVADVSDLVAAVA
jgi:hypothetical protein